jgi:hypothetical protein
MENKKSSSLTDEEFNRRKPLVNNKMTNKTGRSKINQEDSQKRKKT